ncbi:MAG: FKBP-type peptidyl-prolyl cis-trans isomerase [Sphingobacteriales bacterium]
MKRILLLSGFLIILFSACKKQTFNDTRQATIDDLKIQAYIKANKLDFIKDPSGIYYKIESTSTGPRPTATDTVRVSYTGSLLNGTVFQPISTSNLPLPGVIKGFQIGVPLIGTTGFAPFARIKLIIPSALGYGSASQTDGNGAVTIPANSVLYFTVDLLGIYN